MADNPLPNSIVLNFPTNLHSKTMEFLAQSHDGMMDAEVCWLDSMSDYTMTLKSDESVYRDALLRVYAKRLCARKGTRLTRSMKGEIEDLIDQDMQAEYKAYYIAKWEPKQLLPAFANYREVLNEITSNSVGKEKFSMQDCAFCRENSVVCERENPNPITDGFGGEGVKLNTGELVCPDCYNDACCEGVSDNFYYIEKTGIADYGDGAINP